MSVTLFAIVSGALLSLLSVLFLVEDKRERRFAAHIRRMLDQSLESSAAVWRQHTPTINGRFLRVAFHYVSDRVLSVILSVVRVLERYVRRALSFNKKKARTAVPNPSEHLAEIAAHKESAQLTEKEKRVRRDKALRGE